MQPLKGTARTHVAGKASVGRAHDERFINHIVADAKEVSITISKRGRKCHIAKVVHVKPLNCLVIAMVYRHRQTVDHVSLPPSVIMWARQRGIKWWIVRLDETGGCFGLPLDEVEKAGWLKTSEGRPEWFVRLSAFPALPWQRWERFVTDQIDVSEIEASLGSVPGCHQPTTPAATQLQLMGVAL